MQQNPEALRAWFMRVRPYYPELFNAAHLICGNYELAEYALNSAIVELWQQGAPGGAGLRDRLRASLKREAFAAAMSDEGIAAPITWPGIPALRDGDPVTAQLTQERVELQRLALLRYGCGLSPRAICELTGLSPSQVRTELRRFEARCRRRLSEQARARADALIARQCRWLLALPRADMPPLSQAWRAFEAEVSGLPASEHRVSHALLALLSGLLALLCAASFWLFAVLVRPM